MTECGCPKLLSQRFRISVARFEMTRSRSSCSQKRTTCQPAVLECCSLFSVPGDIALKFEGPIVSVDVWLVTVLGAAVPEAPVDEDRDLLSSECDIRPEQLAIDPDGVVLPESVSESMKS